VQLPLVQYYLPRTEVIGKISEKFWEILTVSGKNEVELKGGMYTFMSLKLHTADLSVIDERIADKVQQAPGFFKDSPVVVDLSGVEAAVADGATLNTADLFDRIRAHRLIPIVASVSDKSSPFAASIALPLLEAGTKRKDKDKDASSEQSGNNSDSNSDNKKTTGDNDGAVSLISGNPSSKNRTATETDDEELPEATEVEVVVKTPMLLRRPVRSGQQVYARDTDLIIMGQVGAGAEVLADQNIHVYGPLRGRALCGVSGSENTRIFCQSLEAELVSVAGNYRVLEEIPANLRGKPAQIWLDKDRLNIEPLIDTNLSGVIA